MYGVELLIGARHGWKYDHSQFCTGPSISGPGAVEVCYRHSYFNHSTHVFQLMQAPSEIRIQHRAHTSRIYSLVGWVCLVKRHIVDALFENILSFI